MRNLSNDKNQVLIQRLFTHKIVAIIRGFDQETVLRITEELIRGGINFVEVTLDHSCSDTLITTSIILEKLQSRFSGQAYFGAGTVLNTDQVSCLVSSGAEYIISPNTNPAVIQKTKELGVVSIPGAMTPSEIALAHENGADIVKLYPASELGLSYVRSIRGPLNHVPLMATGGINSDNLNLFFEAGCACAGIGGNLANRAAIGLDNFDSVYLEASKLSALVTGANLPGSIE